MSTAPPNRSWFHALRVRFVGVVAVALAIGALVVGLLVRSSSEQVSEHRAIREEQSAQVGVDAPTRQDSRVVSDGSQSELIDPLGQTRIRVLRADDSTPIAAAVLRIGRGTNRESLSLTTDEQGVARCGKLELAVARVEVRAAGYSSGVFDVNHDVPAEIEWKLYAAGKLEVHFVNEDGTPFSRALITTELPAQVDREIRASLEPVWPDPRGGTPPDSGVTDDRGERVIAGLPVGLPLTIVAEFDELSASTEVTIDPKTRDTRVELVAFSHRCIRGRLVGEDGRPITEHVRIECLDTEDSNLEHLTTKSDETGEFKLCGVPNGRVRWRIQWPGESSRCTELKSGAVDVGTIVLRRALECSGRIRVEAMANVGLSGVTYRVYQGGRIVQSSTHVKDDGSFSTRLPSGPLTLCVELAGAVVSSHELVSPFNGVDIDMAPYFSRIRIRHLPVKSGAPLTMQLCSSASRVSDHAASDFVSHNFTTQGTNALARWKGDDLIVGCAPIGLFDVYVQLAGKFTYCGHVETSPASETVIDASTSLPGKVVVLIKDRNGTPVAGVHVTCTLTSLWRSSAYLPLEGTSDEHGLLTLDDVPIGTTCVYPTSRGRDCDEARIFDVRSGAETRVELAIRGVGSISGTITRDGKPVEGAILSARPSNEHFTPRALRMFHRITKADGTYSITALEEGGYEIMVGSGTPGGIDQRIDSRYVDVVAGHDTRFDTDQKTSLVKLDILRDGVRFDAIEGGISFTRTGVHTLTRAQADEPTWSAAIDSGPCLFLLSSKDLTTFDDPRTPEQYWVAYLPSADTSARRLTVDIRGATVVVHTRDASTTMPFAFLKSVGEFADVASLAHSPFVPFTGDSSSRTFHGVPPGSVLTLTSDRSHVGMAQRRDLVVRDETRIDLMWPQ